MRDTGALFLAALCLCRGGDALQISRPSEWGGLTGTSGSPEVETVRRMHGAVTAQLLKMPESLAGHDTYRVYLTRNVQQAANVYTIFGDKFSSFKFQAHGGEFLQVDAPLGADIGGVHQELWAVKKEAQFDSWLTVGSDNGNADNRLSVVGFDEFAATADGALFAMDPASPPEATLPPASGLADPENSVLVAQLTVPTGVGVTGLLNAQGRSVSGDAKEQKHRAELAKLTTDQLRQWALTEGAHADDVEKAANLGGPNWERAALTDLVLRRAEAKVENAVHSTVESSKTAADWQEYGICVSTNPDACAMHEVPNAGRPEHEDKYPNNSCAEL
jgi:hypothetical protein